MVEQSGLCNREEDQGPSQTSNPHSRALLLLFLPVSSWVKWRMESSVSLSCPGTRTVVFHEVCHVQTVGSYLLPGACWECRVAGAGYGRSSGPGEERGVGEMSRLRSTAFTVIAKVVGSWCTATPAEATGRGTLESQDPWIIPIPSFK